MTISSTTNRVSYTGNGVTTAFSFPYKFLANADLKIYVESVLATITTDYTVTGAGDDAGGTVTFLVAPTNGDEVVILRDPAITQGLDLVENDPLPAEDVENAFDKLTMICQRLQDQVDRTLGVDDSVTSAIDVVIPTPDARKALIWNATSDGLINSTYDPDEQATLAAASAVAASSSESTASAAASAAGVAQTAAEAAQTAAEAAAATIPAYDSLTGEALNYVRLNAGETTMEFRTPAEVLSDIGAQAYDADTTKNDVANVFTQSQTLGAGASLVFEGATADDYEGTLSSADVTADRAWTLPDKSGTVAMTSDITAGGITLGTAVASTSGTSIDFTSIPAGTKRITINFVGVSTNGSSKMIVQLGDSGGVENSGYSGSVTFAETNIAATNHSAGFITDEATNATGVRHGAIVLTLVDAATFTWTEMGIIGRSDSASVCLSGGSKSLSAELDRVRITTASGADTFDAGKINIAYE